MWITKSKGIKLSRQIDRTERLRPITRILINHTASPEAPQDCIIHRCISLICSIAVHQLLRSGTASSSRATFKRNYIFKNKPSFESNGEPQLRCLTIKHEWSTRNNLIKFARMKILVSIPLLDFFLDDWHQKRSKTFRGCKKYSLSSLVNRHVIHGTCFAGNFFRWFTSSRIFLASHHNSYDLTRVFWQAKNCN